MGYTNSPPNPPASNFREKALKQLRTLLLSIFGRSQGFLDSKRLPHAANKVCQVYFGKTNPLYLTGCRRILRSRLQLNPKQLQHFFQTGLGAHLLQWLAPFFQLPDEAAFPDLLLQIAADPDGLSLLSFLRYSPRAFQLNVDHLLFTTHRLTLLLQATEKAIAAISELAAAESLRDSGLGSGVDFTSFPDLTQGGPFAVKQYCLMVERPPQLPLRVTCYQPLQGWDEGSPTPIPVVVQSHGLASSPEDLAEYAQHLASHGYFVAAPQHSGSDVDYAREMLAGRSPEVFDPSAFIHRPQDISALLDYLECRNLADFGGHLNLSAVGILGYSFGAYTAFALAGADIQFEKLADACGGPSRPPNPSLLLQCQALGLPRQAYRLHDPRIQAILAMESLGSEMFGSQGLSTIQVPVLLMAGSHDAVTPLVLEQARIFLWLTAPQRYLALMQGKSHLRDMPHLVQQLELQIKLLPQTPRLSCSRESAPFDPYTQALSLAFFNQQLRPNFPSPRLSAAYAASMSHVPYGLWLISHHSSHALREALQQINQERVAEQG